MKKYKMIQIPEDSYTLIKEYCKIHNKKMGMEVASLIYKHTQAAKPTPTNVLKVRT